MHSRRHGMAAILVVMMLVVLAGCGGNAKPTPAKKIRNVTEVLTTPDVGVYTSVYTSLPDFLGYWEAEGLKVTVQPTAGSSAGTQLLAAGQADFANTGTAGVLAAFPKAPDLRMVSFNITTNFYELGVPENSQVQAVAGLKGKNIGVQSFSAASYFFARAVVAEAGLNPDADITWLPVGVGAQALEALNSGKINAYAAYDGPNSQIESMGFKLRYFNTPLSASMGGLAGFAVREQLIKEQPDMVAGFARAVAKATVFAKTNPEAAVRIHWKLYPDSKPKGVPEDEALRQSVHILRRRLAVSEKDADTGLWGGIPVSKLQKLAQFLFDSKQITEMVDLNQVFDSSLLKQINSFDEQAVIKQAKEFTGP